MSDMSDIKICIDFGSTFTKGVAFDLATETVLVRVQTPSTVETDVTDGLSRALDMMGRRVSLGDEEIQGALSCSSAAGGLKMVCVGLVPDYTTKAGHMAALGAGAKVAGLYSYELTETELADIARAAPDIILLTGGTDGGNKKVIAHNARQLAKIAGSLSHVIVAGNKSANDEIKAAFADTGIDVNYTDNIMPEFGRLELGSVNEMIRDVFLNRITEAKGVAKVADIISGIAMPTPSAVLEAATLIANGTKNVEGLGELLLVDVGGATTDVDSIARGVPTRDGVHTVGLLEPYAKRTVEGDLGMYHNLDTLADIARENMAIAEKYETGEALGDAVDRERFERELETLRAARSVPESREQIQRQLMLARLAVKTAADRHAGSVEAIWTHDGDVWVQRGKDLSKVKYVIGTGGPLAFSSNPRYVLEGAQASPEQPNVLKPLRPNYLLDEQYILFAIGLLAQKHPDKALRIALKYLKRL
jgi:uncharacterized protein (TIGR01319 family)